ncbi:Listeria-Bacteroides repeat domain [Bifidobacterium sp. DSM 109963]|uniref:Listeria-Bacteroides repeat domain n=2 Tax=Bifidobacterium panos TaxID=2675321 RepID=A0ABX1SXG8_9BIFI|nr:Listeria-Bacteroides repeat domain [Bifidobacterium sp. DSM 109963]
MDRVAGRPVWRRVCAVVAVIATMLAVMVAPAARAAETEVSSWDGALAALAGDADTVTYTVSADTAPGATLTVPAGKTLVVKGSASLTGGTSGESLFEVADGGHLVLDGVTLTGNTVGDKGAVYVAKGGTLELGSDSATAAAPSITGNTNAGSACNLVVEKDAKVYLNASPDKPIGLSYSGTVEEPVSLVMSGRHTIQSTDVAAGKIAADDTGQATVTANGCVLVRSATPKILYWSPTGVFSWGTNSANADPTLTARQVSNWDVSKNYFNSLGDLTVIHGAEAARVSFVDNAALNGKSIDQFDLIYIEPSWTKPEGDSYYTDAETEALRKYLDKGGRIFIQCEDTGFTRINESGTALAKALNTGFQVKSAPKITENAPVTSNKNGSATAKQLTEGLPENWKVYNASPISYTTDKVNVIFTATASDNSEQPICVDLQAGSDTDKTPWGNVTVISDGNIWSAQWAGKSGGKNTGYTTQFAKNLLNATVESRNVAATGANPNERFVVTFNSNGGSAVDSETVLKGSKVSEPEAPTWVGHALVGWYSDASLADDKKWDFDTSTMPGENLTLYAKWTTEASYTVKHYLQNVDGSYPSDPAATDTLTGTIGQNTAAVAKTTYTGFTAPESIAQVEVKADGSAEVVVKYTRNEYTVKFEANGGTGDMADQSFKYDEDKKALSENLFTRDGYTFTGWKDKDDSTKTYTDGQSVQNLTAVDEGVVTLQAQWDPNTDTAYKVEHYLQNVDDDLYPATPDATDSKTGTTDTKTAAEAKTTYTGFTAKDFSQENIAGNGKTVVKIYYERDKYDVTFDAKGHGTTPDKQESVKYGAKVKNPGDLLVDGYSFGGWYTDDSFDDDTKWDFATGTMPAENLTLYAKWTANTDTKYTVEHYLQNVDDDSYPDMPKDVVPMTGTTDTETVAEVNEYEGFTPVDFAQENIAGDGSTVVKIYYERVKHGVTFDAKGHGVTPDKLTGVKYGAKVANPGDLSQDGYTFGGWYTDESFADEKKWDFGTGTMPAENLTLFAKWTANTDTAYKVEHYLQNVDDDSYPDTPRDVVPMTGTTDTKTVAEVNGYEGFAPVDFAQENIAGDGSTVVKIYYTRVKHDVTFDAKGHGTTPDKLTGVKYGAKVANPGDLSQAGYAFGGWYTDGSFADDKKWDFSTNTMPANDLTLFAKWTANTDTKYTVEHYLQNVDDDSYPDMPKDVDPMTGTTDTETVAEVNEYEGFTPVDFAQENIAGDGSTVVKIYYERVKHGVTFDAKGHGVTPDKLTGVKYGAKVANPGDLSQAGYAFGGWYTDGSFADEKKWDFAKNTMPAENLTLFAKWTANTDTAYKVEHYLQNVDDDSYTLDATDSKTGTTDTETVAEAKSYTGFTAGDVTQGNIAGDGSTVVKIYYTRAKHDVTFDAKGHGTAPTGLTGVKYGAKVANPGDLSAEGYVFGGWYADEACTQVWDFAVDVMPAGNLTLFAKWGPASDTKYTVKLFRQALDGSYGSEPDVVQVLTGETNADTVAVARSYEGFTAEPFSQQKIAADGSTVVTIRYARNAYTVSFNAKGHGTAPAARSGVKYGATLDNPGGLSAEGYTFGGWYADEACTQVWDFTADTMPANDVTLYAKWTVNEYEITYDLNDGTLPADAPKTHTYDAETELPTPTRDGYTFDGWYDENGNKVDTIPTDVKDMKITAKWTGNEYNITYDPNDGTLPEDAPKTHTYGEETKLPAPTKDGYTFDGWYDENGNKLDTIPTDTKDIKITAKWKGNEYDITYDLNGGTLPADAPKTHTYGEETKLPVPTRDGYTFDGWYDENGNKVDTIPADATDMKITAKWTADEYDITYDLDGGTLPADAPKTHTYGQETKLPTPTRDGYTFDGWYDEDGNKIDTIPADATDMKITAKWTKNADTDNGTKYDPNGGALPEGWTGADGKLPTPTREGYKFDGWYDDEGNLVTSLKDAAGKTLHARWTKLNTLASTGATGLAAGLTALALAAAGVTVGVLRRKRSR